MVDIDGLQYRYSVAPNDKALHERFESDPRLAGLTPAQRMKFYRACYREVKRDLPPTLRAGRWLVLCLLGLIVLWSLAFPVRLIFLKPDDLGATGDVIYWTVFGVFNFVNILVVIAVSRAMRRRVAVRLDQVLADGHFPVCLACDYDLRATPDGVCPECGASMRLPARDEEPSDV